MRAEALDFVQINYALDDRSAEQRILPLAAERGVAVLINRPFGGGNLLRRLGGRALPGWAADIGATSWAQVLLRFVLAHPAVSCAIPGTGNPVPWPTTPPPAAARFPAPISGVAAPTRSTSSRDLRRLFVKRIVEHGLRADDAAQAGWPAGLQSAARSANAAPHVSPSRNPPRPVGRTAQATAHPDPRRQDEPGQPAQAPQVYHLYHFIEPLLAEALAAHPQIQPRRSRRRQVPPRLHPLRPVLQESRSGGTIFGIETRDELVANSRRLADKLEFNRGMRFYNLSVAESIESERLPERVDVVTALHACDTATDDAIRFALRKQARFIVLVPCCQAEVAAVMRRNKQRQLGDGISELWRHPIHTREFGSHATNVLRCLQLESHGYQVSVTELVGWEHSMKNELIIASYKDLPADAPAERLTGCCRRWASKSSRAVLLRRMNRAAMP